MPKLITPEKLKELLVSPGHVSAEDFAHSRDEAREQKKFLGDVLVDHDLIKDQELGQLIAQDLGYNFINLRQEKVEEKVLMQVPEIVARVRGIIAFQETMSEIKVGMVNPADLEMIHILEKRYGKVIRPHYVTKRDWQEALAHYRRDLKDEIKTLFKGWQNENLPKPEKDQVVVKFVDLLLFHASVNRASDIHIEPTIEKTIIRFRIDSIMHQVLELPRSFLDPVLMRIKILAKMRTDEHRRAQDGKFQFAAADEKIDIRVSIVPVTGGENVVMRLLSAKARQMSLGGLGFSPKDHQKVNQIVTHPQGMILSTGPTGSGKTTTLYALLKILNHVEVNIATIEDPVEYDIPGIGQIQVNPKTNLTFAEGLRAIVRQDPDIIMVGEVRDQETARIAINSAMTGHLVLSTMHANDAATTLPRLLDMGIEPFLVASTTKVIIGQRLVRKICPKCRASYQITAEEIKLIDQLSKLKSAITQRGINDLKKIRFYKGEGCKVCANSGFSGRVGIFEVLIMDDEIKDLVLRQASSDEIAEEAEKGGMTTILQDGVNKVFNGITTLQEIIRVTESG